MNDIALLGFGHLLCLVYWLGADLGVFYSSYFVADENLSRETRLTVAKLLFALDQCPRIAMPLMFGFGAHLAWRMGLLPVPGLGVVGIWAVCLGWLALVLTLHARGGAARRLAALDLCLRVTIVVLLLAWGGYGLLTGGLVGWLALKILIFAALVTLGLAIRRRLAPFGPAFAALAEGRETEADNRTIRSVFASTRPLVLAIWAGLLINTALGLHVV